MVRYPADQKLRAKDAILRAASNAFRANGYNGIGIDGVAAAAGVTSGAFYSNFSSKEDLLKEVISTRLGEPFLDIAQGSLAERRDRLRAYLQTYISNDHQPQSCNGCVIPTLSADVSRSGPSVRAAYAEKMAGFIRKIGHLLPGTPDHRERKAWTILSIMVGAVSVAQALPAGSMAEKVLDAALEGAILISESP